MDFVKTNPPYPQEHKLKGQVSPGLFFCKKTLDFNACPKTAGSVPGVGKRRKMVGAAGFEPATPTHTVLSWLFIERPYFLPSSLIRRVPFYSLGWAFRSRRPGLFRGRLLDFRGDVTILVTIDEASELGAPLSKAYKGRPYWFSGPVQPLPQSTYPRVRPSPALLLAAPSWARVCLHDFKLVKCVFPTPVFTRMEKASLSCFASSDRDLTTTCSAAATVAAGWQRK